jgi:hypothetical protein
VVKDEFQFRPLNFTYKLLNVNEKILWSGEPLSCQCRLHVPKKPNVGNQKVPVRSVRWMEYSNNGLFSEKVLRDL